MLTRTWGVYSAQEPLLVLGFGISLFDGCQSRQDYALARLGLRISKMVTIGVARGNTPTRHVQDLLGHVGHDVPTARSDFHPSAAV